MLGLESQKITWGIIRRRREGLDVGKGGIECLEGRGQGAGACLPQCQAVGRLWTVLESVAWFSSFHGGRHQLFLRW